MNQSSAFCFKKREGRCTNSNLAVINTVVMNQKGVQATFKELTKTLHSNDTTSIKVFFVLGKEEVMSV